MRRLLMRDSHILASHLTPVEITSALWRRRHHEGLDAYAHHQADAAFAEITRRWSAMPALDVIVRATSWQGILFAPRTLFNSHQQFMR
jgi:hypothetical protein